MHRKLNKGTKCDSYLTLENTASKDKVTVMYVTMKHWTNRLLSMSEVDFQI